MNKTKSLWSTPTCLLALGLLALGGQVAAAPVAPGGLYVGYYQEDPRTNPEDPMPGAFLLKLPEQDAAFDGAMYFTFVGCQTSNVGKVKGAKAGVDLKGSWSGRIDGSDQSGPYEGKYDAAKGYYAGTYANSGGKQFKNIPGCIKYYIGPNGSWEMFPVEQNQPASFKVAVNGATMTWPAVANAAMTLVYVIDPAVAQAGTGNPIVYQTILMRPATSFSLEVAALNKGKQYIAVALINSRSAARLAISSKRFVAQ